MAKPHAKQHQAASTSGATPPREPANDPVTALAALYQGEKTDASYVFNTAMVMMGVAVAYLVGAIPFVDKVSRGPIAWLFVLLLPVPLWLIAAFHSLMTLNAMSHGISVRIIENALFDESGLAARNADRELVGSAAGDRIMDITQAKVIHKVTTVVVYAGVALLVMGFTAYALHAARRIIAVDPALVRARVFEMATATYGLLTTMVGLSWIIGLKAINANRRRIP
jgi:hypothetical protein